MADFYRLTPKGVIQSPAIEISTEERELLLPAAIALYSVWHGVTPDALTPAGKSEAEEWLPLLQAVHRL